MNHVSIEIPVIHSYVIASYFTGITLNTDVPEEGKESARKIVRQLLPLLNKEELGELKKNASLMADISEDTREHLMSKLASFTEDQQQFLRFIKSAK